jgi:hypothetical protein
LPVRIIGGSGTSHGSIEFQDPNTTADYKVTLGSKGDDLYLQAGGGEKARITSGGHLLVGKTSQDATNTVGAELKNTGELVVTTDGTAAAYFNRKTSDGTIAEFRKDNSAVGSIGSNLGRFYIHNNYGSGSGFRFDNAAIRPSDSSGASEDATTDLGASAARFKNLYLSGQVNAGTISSGAITATTLDTGQGANELYAMNQNVRTTDSPTFGGLTLNGGVDFNGSNINDINQINGSGGSGWLDFNMDTDSVYPQSTADNQTVLGSITHMNFVGDSNGNGTGGIFYWGYGVDSSDSGTFTQTMALDRSGNLTLTGALRGPATFTIDPAAVGDNTGTVVIAGNLQVDGTTTTINSTTLTVDDKNITLASGSTNGSAANGAGLTVDCGSNEDATWTYSFGDDAWKSNKHILAYTGDGTGVFAVGRDANQAIQIDVSDTYNKITAHQDSDENQDHFFDLIRDFEGTGRADFRILNGSDVHMLVDKTGNVGIGTASPERALHVVGGIHLPNSNIISWDQADGTLRNAMYVDSGDDMIIGDTNFDDIYFSTGQKTKTVVIKQTTGRVGVGTSAPSSLVHTSLGNQALGFDAGFFASANPSDYTVGRGAGITMQNADVYVGGIYGIRETNGWEGALAFYTHTSSSGNTFGTTFTEKMRITNDGNVGIGTTSPSGLLHVKHASGEAKVIIQAGSNTSSAVLQFGDSLDTSRGAIEYTSTDDMVFSTNNMTEAMRIRYTGNVGIGTSSPSSTLHVKSTGNGEINIERASGALINLQAQASAAYIGTNSNHQFGLKANGSVRLKIATSGAISFNDAFTFPTSDGSGNQVLRTDGSGNVSWATVQGVGAPTYMEDADGDTKIQVEESADEDTIRFDTAGSERMQIAASGRVGIGHGAPNAQFHINAGNNNSVTIGDATNPALQIGGTTNYRFGVYTDNETAFIENKNGDDGIAFRVKTAGEAMRIDGGTGNVGIGTTTPDTRLDVTTSGVNGLVLNSDTATTTNSARLFLKASGGTVGMLNVSNSLSFRTGMTINSTSGTERLNINSTHVASNNTVLLKGANDNSGKADFALNTGGSPTVSLHGTQVQLGSSDQNWNGKISYVSGSGVYFSAWDNDLRLTTSGGSSSSAKNIRFEPQASGGSSTLRMIVNGDGNVGIGTASPNVPLEIHGADIATATTTTSSSVLRLVRDVVDSSFPLRKDSAVDFMLSRQQAVANNFPYTRLDIRLSGGSTDSHSPSLDVMSLLHNGNVGIGTVAPATPLHVAGTVRSQVQGSSSFADYKNTQIYVNSGPFNIAVNGKIRLADQNNNPALTVDNANDRVGIGIDTPGATLHLQNSSTNSEVMRITTTGDNPDRNMYFQSDHIYSNGSLYWGDGSHRNLHRASFHTFHYGTGNTEAMRIHTNGNVGIGTTSPSRKLDISAPGNDGIRIASANALIGGGASGGDTQLIYWNGSTAYYGRSSLGGSVSGHEFRVGGVTKLNVNSSGNTIASGTVSVLGGEVYLGVEGTASGHINAYENLTFNLDVDNNDTARAFSFHVNGASGSGTELMRLTEDGKLGIGTSSPTNKLDVTGTASFTNIRLGSNASGEGIIRHAVGGYNGIGITTGSLSSTGIQLFVQHPTAGGGVGIGTTSPAAKLQVEALGIDTTTTATSATTQVAIDTMAAATFRSAEFTIQGNKQYGQYLSFNRKFY